jgi:hypothetical protein
MVSMCRKSQAMMLFACAVRNSCQVGPLRRGAGSMPAACRMFQTVDAAMVWPSRASSPWILRCPHRLFSVASRRTSWRIAMGVAGRPGSSGCVVPFPGDESAVPGQQGRRRDGKDRCPSATGDEPGQGAEPEPVRGLVAQVCAELAVQDRILVSQDQELGVPAGLTAKQCAGNREQVPGHVVQQRDDHARIVST